MSCFVVSKLDIDAIVTCALPLLADADPDAIGRMLWLENVRSVAYRYNLATRDPDELAGYAVEAVQYQFTRLPLSPVEARKVVDCYDDQTCEHAEYETSRARELIAKLEQALPIDKGLEYDRASCGL